MFGTFAVTGTLVRPTGPKASSHHVLISRETRPGHEGQVGDLPCPYASKARFERTTELRTRGSGSRMECYRKMWSSSIR
ncbi:hypothetical protein AB1N83_013155 [Pleurotus pulmonarius]